MDDEATVLRQRMDETMAGLNHKLGVLEQQVSETVKTARDTVLSVRDTFDLKLHVRQRPWSYVAGAAALGFLFGLHSARRAYGPVPYDSWYANSPVGRISAVVNPYSGNGDSLEPVSNAQLVTAVHPYSGNGSTYPPGAQRHFPTTPPRWLISLGNTFQPEISELKGIAIGALLERVRGLVAKHAAGHAARPAEKTGKRAERYVDPSDSPKSPPGDDADANL